MTADDVDTRPRVRSAVVAAVVGLALVAWAATFEVVCSAVGGAPCGTQEDRHRTALVCAGVIVGALALYLAVRPRVRPGQASTTLFGAFCAVLGIAVVVTTSSTGFVAPTF